MVSRAGGSRAPPDGCCRRTSGRPATPAAPHAGSRSPARRCSQCRTTSPAKTARAPQDSERKIASRSTSNVRDSRSTIEVQHLVQIGFGIQVAAELDQRLPVVITLAVEELVEIILHPVLERIEQQGRHRDGHNQSHRSRAGKVSGGTARKPRPLRRSRQP